MTIPQSMAVRYRASRFWAVGRLFPKSVKIEMSILFCSQLLRLMGKRKRKFLNFAAVQDVKSEYFRASTI